MLSGKTTLSKIMKRTNWNFWIDRGGTFTDIVASSPRGKITTLKLLSENSTVYKDAAIYGIRHFLQLKSDEPIPPAMVGEIKMGTTVATNALLEKKGEPTLLAITRGLADVIEIGTQDRPDTFALKIEKPPVLYDSVIEISERVLASGLVEKTLNQSDARKKLQIAFDQGIRSVAIVLMHAHRFPDHEIVLAEIARAIGFQQISVSHDVSPLAKIVSRGETTIVDAYLTPNLNRYINTVATQLHDQTSLLFMQSSGGLVEAEKFRGRDAILSGPAGGVVGAVATARLAGFDKVIGFDMGGTSTDVFHYAGEFEKVYETQIAGVRMRVPMLDIHTVAAGGGSILKFENGRFRVGPESSGADPGPLCYRNGGQLSVTDINVALGRIVPEFFPSIFGPDRNQPLDVEVTRAAFLAIVEQLNDGRSAEHVAEGFLEIAVEHMAQAIKKITIERGHDVQDYVLNCFGGAGGQHACRVADRLGISKIFLHPLAGVLSAYGMGLASLSTEKQQIVDHDLSALPSQNLEQTVRNLADQNVRTLSSQGVDEIEIKHVAKAHLRYRGTNTLIEVEVTTAEKMQADFYQQHLRKFGFVAKDKTIWIDTVIVESIGGSQSAKERSSDAQAVENVQPIAQNKMFTGGSWHDTPVFEISNLQFGHTIEGPAIIVGDNDTIVIEPDWTAAVDDYGHLIVEKIRQRSFEKELKTNCDPVKLEIFNHQFMSIAQQMGIVLQNTSQSVNVKERLDFSCAIFDVDGNLVANAPHVPVHLGSMDSAVKVIINSDQSIDPGDVFVQNNPYNGGSHLPDITVVTPVFGSEDRIEFFVASRAHHEDVGGIAPGSMSPNAKTILEEGVTLDCEKMIERGVFQTERITQMLGAPPYPARNIPQNIADLMAQAAANETGVRELNQLVSSYGRPVVFAYMKHIQDFAEESVRSLVGRMEEGAFKYQLDEGESISVAIKPNHAERTLTIDFTGTSKQLANNRNAPAAITRAAVLYVLRCLVADDVLLNSGCMKPVTLIIPSGSMLNPVYPAAVVAGNVETSQAVTNALFAAIGALGSSQGTMNNFTFGNDRYQYYETICSGSPAGPGFDGVAAVHTHMTNTRMTDPEILEQRYPVVLDEFSIRRGSGGRGKWSAGDGVKRRIRFLESMECSILSGHRVVCPFGIDGGATGQIGVNKIFRSGGGEEDIGGNAQRTVEPEDAIEIVTPTGGGFGVKPSSNTM